MSDDLPDYEDHSAEGDDFLDALLGQASNMLEEQMRGLDIEVEVEEDVVAVKMSDDELGIGVMLAFENGSDVEERITFMLNLFPQAAQAALAQMEVK